MDVQCCFVWAPCQVLLRNGTVQAAVERRVEVFIAKPITEHQDQRYLRLAALHREEVTAWTAPESPLQ